MRCGSVFLAQENDIPQHQGAFSVTARGSFAGSPIEVGVKAAKQEQCEKGGDCQRSPEVT